MKSEILHKLKHKNNMKIVPGMNGVNFEQNKIRQKRKWRWRTSTNFSAFNITWKQITSNDHLKRMQLPETGRPASFPVFNII